MKIEIDDEQAYNMLANVMMQDYNNLTKHDWCADNKEELIAAYKVLIKYYATESMRESYGIVL